MCTLISGHATFECTSNDLTFKTRQKFDFHFHFEFFRKFISFAYGIGLTNHLHCWVLGEEKYLCMKVQNFWGQKVLEVKGWFGNCEIICHSTLGIQFSPIRRHNQKLFMVVSLWWEALLVWEFSVQLETCTFGGLFQEVGWCVANFFVPNIWRFNIVLVSFFCTLYVVECHAINKCRGFKFLSWFLCRDHKSGDLC